MKRRSDYHFVGVAGIGMSALARLLVQRGARVSGSDRSASALLDKLRKEGVDVTEATGRIGAETKVVTSTAISPNHPVVALAKEYGSRLLHRSELLAELMVGQKPLLVAGTHGKTTTTALLAHILSAAGWDPSFAIGGILTGSQTNGRYGKGEYFVAEADESDGSFTRYTGYGAIVTGIERDHMDHYGSEAKLLYAFRTFIDRIERQDLLFWCGDDAQLSEMGLPGTSYGFSEAADLRITNFRQTGFTCRFDLGSLEVELPLCGRHNALNAAAAAGLALKLGVSPEAVREGVATFAGVARRCEHRGEVRGALVIDDYAHHPTEVAATLRAIREAAQGRRVIALFQPHRYTRLDDCMDQFALSFGDADHLVVTEVYSAGEEPIKGATGKALAEQAGGQFVPRFELISTLLKEVRPHDIVVMLGAGDITSVAGDLVTAMEERPPRKWAVTVACGGRSAEHYVSMVSSRNIYRRLDPALYDVGYCVVPSDGELVTSGILDRLLSSELVVPVFHGPNGEDGMYAALLHALRVPFVGCNMTASAVAMDKGLTKRVVESGGVRTARYVDVARRDWAIDRVAILSQAEQLKFPLYVKPVHFGSSIGIVYVDAHEQLEAAIDEVVACDDAALVEEAIVGARDIEFAVLGNDEVDVPPPGEILTGGKIYDYQGKCGANPTPTRTRADLSDSLIEEGRELALRVYRLLRCDGLARVDFLLDGEGRYWLNEVNPMPGFTEISLYPKMWEESGLPYSRLLDRLIVLALQRARALA